MTPTTILQARTNASKPTCTTCRHAVTIPAGGTYARTHLEGEAIECHRSAPTLGHPDPHHVRHAAWPRVAETDTCSEYATRDGNTTPMNPLGDLMSRAADLLRIDTERRLKRTRSTR